MSDYPMVLSFFEDKWATVPTTVPSTFTELAETLRYASTLDRPRTDKTKVMSVVPALFDPPKRLKDNITERYCFTGDVDGDTGFILTFDEMVAALRAHGLAFIVHTTTKSSVQTNRYRVILPYARPLTVHESEAASSSIHQMLGEVFDTKTFDAGRLSIFPQAWRGDPADALIPWDENDTHHAFEADVCGAPLDADAIMAAYPPQPKAATVSAASQAQVQAFLAAQTTRPIDFHILTDLDRSPIVKAEWIDAFQTAQAGGRMFSFLNKIAGRGIALGYAIDVQTLVILAQAMDARTGTRGRVGLVREAEKALGRAIAYQQQQALSPASPKYSDKQLMNSLKARKTKSRVRY